MGARRTEPGTIRYTTAGDVDVWRTVEAAPPDALEEILDGLDSRRGVLLQSSFEYPGRYRLGARGFVDPPLAFVARGRRLRIEALNPRGEVLLGWIAARVSALPALESCQEGPLAVEVVVREVTERFAEDARSRQPSVFAVLRAVLDLFRAPGDPLAGLYGAFGYDLVFQFENLRQQVERQADQRDLVLYLPDRMVVCDDGGTPLQVSWEYAASGPDGERTGTAGVTGGGAESAYSPAATVDRERDQPPGHFAELVGRAKEAFRRGDLFEVVAGQTFFRPCVNPPSELFRRLRSANPAPYGALANLGSGEYLVAASPEMYVRVGGDRVESCPISGTIARGADVFGDERNIRALLNSAKDESELTMCTDVDRNDKSRICRPGSVRVIGRRQIELYSRLIHTVDHVEGTLMPEFDAIDAFLTHMWAVTVTGAPKLWAMRFIEANERSPRRWYGGAFGQLGFDGDVDTGLTLRTVQIRDGVAEVRAGDTLLIDSDAEAEERETELKASAFLDALSAAPAARLAAAAGPSPVPAPGPREADGEFAGVRVLFIDHEDSFVHTLANYVRRTGAVVRTERAPIGRDELDAVMADFAPDLVLLSPGPGRPEDFATSATIELALHHRAAVFGVCLGLQGITEYYGGRLGLLDYPMHGKRSDIEVTGGAVFAGLPQRFSAGRYHSIYAIPDSLPAELVVTARSDDGVVMAVEHAVDPVAAVQFHPESIMTADGDVGFEIVVSAMRRLVAERDRRSAGTGTAVAGTAVAGTAVAGR